MHENWCFEVFNEAPFTDAGPQLFGKVPLTLSECIMSGKAS